ncbi:MAG: flagellar protein FliT [Armatimonadota bacterium]|nr:flagellar protein FliT [bacterium]MDW8103618.1 flagellar protein FliT [Armatimonadota bacterium]MDW8291208.1 flagellar protein FliT [Armatimonadota bacterium]
MQPDDDTHWQQWMATHGERIRLLSFLQEEAISQQQWETLVQLTVEKEQLLQRLWHAPPTQLPPAVLAFVQELWSLDMRLQQLLEQQRTLLHAEISRAQQLRSTLQHYHTNPPLGSIEDRAV